MAFLNAVFIEYRRQDLKKYFKTLFPIFASLSSSLNKWCWRELTIETIDKYINADLIYMTYYSVFLREIMILS